MSLSSPTHETSEAATSLVPKPTLDRAAAAVMARIAEDAAQQSGGKVQFSTREAMRGTTTAALATPEVKS